MTTPDLSSGACIGDDFPWFSTQPADIAYAIKACQGCPVRQACLDFTLAMERGTRSSSRFGIAGGKTGVQRDRIARGLPPARALTPCGTTSAYKRHVERGEPKCDPCRAAMREYNAANLIARKARVAVAA